MLTASSFFHDSLEDDTIVTGYKYEGERVIWTPTLAAFADYCASIRQDVSEGFYSRLPEYERRALLAALRNSMIEMENKEAARLGLCNVPAAPGQYSAPSCFDTITDPIHDAEDGVVRVKVPSERSGAFSVRQPLHRFNYA